MSRAAHPTRPRLQRLPLLDARDPPQHAEDLARREGALETAPLHDSGGVDRRRSSSVAVNCRRSSSAVLGRPRPSSVISSVVNPPTSVVVGEFSSWRGGDARPKSVLGAKSTQDPQVETFVRDQARLTSASRKARIRTTAAPFYGGTESCWEPTGQLSGVNPSSVAIGRCCLRMHVCLSLQSHRPRAKLDVQRFRPLEQHDEKTRGQTSLNRTGVATFLKQWRGWRRSRLTICLRTMAALKCARGLSGGTLIFELCEKHRSHPQRIHGTSESACACLRHHPWLGI